jgi:hypothetical protein
MSGSFLTHIFSYLDFFESVKCTKYVLNHLHGRSPAYRRTTEPSSLTSLILSSLSRRSCCRCWISSCRISVRSS